MNKVRYKFTRTSGILSANSLAIDALDALFFWIAVRNSRQYKIIEETEKFLIVELTFEKSDAANDLPKFLKQGGVEPEVVPEYISGRHEAPTESLRPTPSDYPYLIS